MSGNVITSVIFAPIARKQDFSLQPSTTKMNLVALLLSLILISTAEVSVDLCKPDEYACPAEDKCIPWHWFCDGRADCKDGSDELSSESSSEGLVCRRHRFTCLLPLEYETKKDIFCKDRVECGSDDFACADGSRCIPWNYFCDGDKECWDGSDEAVFQPGLPGVLCRTGRAYSYFRECLLPEAYMHKQNQTCEDISTCKPHEFACLDESGCLPATWFCNGINDCKDGSDEISIHSELPGIPCRAKFQRSSILARICKLPQVHASQKDQICEKEAKCFDNEFACLDGTECVDWFHFCFVFNPSCSDKSDVIPIRSKYNGIPCRVHHRAVRTLCKLPRMYASKKRDICEGAPRCRHNEFSCLDGTLCLPANYFCDGLAACGDKSDEPKTTNESKIICRRGSNFCELPVRLRRKRKMFCDEIVKCSVEHFECSNGEKCIPKDQFCDGTRQCSDGSDEILSTSGTNGTACLGGHGIVCALYGNEALKKDTLCKLQCRENEFMCRDQKTCLGTSWWCEGGSYCRDGSDNDLSQLPPGMTGIPCRIDRYICILPEDQKNKKEHLCKKNAECDEDEFACLDGSACFPKESFCDGYKNCFDGSDEISPASNVSGVTCRGKFDYNLDSLFRENICVLPEAQAEKKNIFCVKH